MRYRDTKRGFGIVAVCFVLIAVLLCGIMTSWFKDWNPYCWFGHEYGEDGICGKCGAEKPVDKEQEIEENNQQLAFAFRDGKTLSLRRVANTSDISSGETGSTTITATVSSDATDKSVSWSVAWKDASSEWANGKDIAEYITLTADDEANSVRVDCLKAFGEQAILTCSANGADGLTATATVDFMKRIVGVKLVCEGINLHDGKTQLETSGEGLTTLKATIEYGVGTVENNTVTQFRVSGVDFALSDALKTGIANDVQQAQEQGSVSYNESISYNPTSGVSAVDGECQVKVRLGFENFFSMNGGNNVHVKAARGRVYRNVGTEGWYIAATAHVHYSVGGEAKSMDVSVNIPISTAYLTNYVVPNSIDLSTDHITF